jgi:microcystin-dependent protein
MTNTSFIGRKVDFPSGIIIPWSGSMRDVPRGWVFCDGNNGTPDLRNRYPCSVPNGTTDPGTRGGENSKTLSTNQLPSHNHDVSTSTDGSHTHKVQQYTDTGEYDQSRGDGDFPDTGGSGSKTSGTNGSHNHSLNIGSTGSGNSYNNQPSYTELTFIMKL